MENSMSMQLLDNTIMQIYWNSLLIACPIKLENKRPILAYYNTTRAKIGNVEI